MGLVLGIISLVRLNYDQLIRRFPEGGGAVAATGAAFGEGWAFLPLGALVVDFVLTIAISVAAAASAVIAYVAAVAPFRVEIALGLCGDREEHHVNLGRGYPIVSLVASGAIGGAFAWLWVRQGRPRGIAQVEAEAERELGAEEDQNSDAGSAPGARPGSSRNTE